MRHLVIGRGQVGSALIEVLSERYEVKSIDVNSGVWPGVFDVIHVCIPYNENFKRAVSAYCRQYLEPFGLVIIHSTVAVGISQLFGAVHSPIRGVHPNLAEGIRTFTKYFGGVRAGEAADIFRKLGIKCVTTPDAKNTEALKLWDTTYYGWNIVFEKAVKEYCDKYGLDFDLVYRQANVSYNKGYAELGMSYVQRPVLGHREGPIGGHCVIPNARILNDGIADFILFLNEQLEMRKEAA